MSDLYAAAGVDTHAGDHAVDLMRAAIKATHSSEVVGGVGGFAGLFDASRLRGMRRPLLATSTDGVGTKVAIAQAIDKHDTIGQDLVGMVVDDIVVVGAEPLFMTDYIACGRLVPERIAEIVGGIARAAAATGTALTGGETAEHPGLLAPDEYDVAGAVTGVVEADRMLGPDRVRPGDTVVALASSGLHANGYSLVRRILSDRGIDLRAHAPELGATWGEALLEPTMLYTGELVRMLAADVPIAALSHVTGGGIAANLARVLPAGCAVEVDRASWSPQPVFRVLCDLAGARLQHVEGTWNLGIGMFAITPEPRATLAAARAEGFTAWVCGTVTPAPADLDGFTQGAKGVNGGAVRLVGDYPG